VLVGEILVQIAGEEIAQRTEVVRAEASYGVVTARRQQPCTRVCHGVV